MKEIKNKLVELLKEQIMDNYENACTEELGEVMDMIKDISEMCKYDAEREYYKHVVDAMEKADESITMATLAHDPSMISRMYYTNPDDHASLKEYIKLVEHGADAIARMQALDRFARRFADEIHSIDVTAEEKEKLKAYMAGI